MPRHCMFSVVDFIPRNCFRFPFRQRRGAVDSGRGCPGGATSATSCANINVCSAKTGCCDETAETGKREMPINAPMPNPQDKPPNLTSPPIEIQLSPLDPFQLSVGMGWGLKKLAGASRVPSLGHEPGLDALGPVLQKPIASDLERNGINKKSIQKCIGGF